MRTLADGPVRTSRQRAIRRRQVPMTSRTSRSGSGMPVAAAAAAADDGKRREWLEDLRQDPVIEEATRILDDLRAAPTAQSAFPLPPAAA